MTDDKQIAAKIDAGCQTGDNESDHWEADRILCELLESLGYRETVEAWHKVGKWYA